MLDRLKIKNYILIESLEIDFSNGLNILTGETGAGKSILIDSLSLLFGKKATGDIIRKGSERAVIEAGFSINNKELNKFLHKKGIEIEENYLIIKREIRKDGSRGFINGSAVPISTLKDIGVFLLDIHGQHDQQSLLNAKNHLKYLDMYSETLSLLENYKNIFNEYNTKKRVYTMLTLSEEELLKRKELLQYAVSEIKKAKLKKGEYLELEQERKKMSNVKLLSESISEAYKYLSSAFEKTGFAISLLEKMIEFDNKITEILSPIQEGYYYLEEGNQQLSAYLNALYFDPALLEEIEARMNLIYDLKKKYGDSIEAVLEYAKKAEKKLEEMESSEFRKEELKKEIEDIEKVLIRAALNLSKERKKKVAELEREVKQELNELGMSGTQFRSLFKYTRSTDGLLKIDSERYTLGPNGAESIEFLIAPNAGEDLKPIYRIASGGELSRIMLALKTALYKLNIVDTMIFDEIDSGIGGRIADVVGKKLKNLSKNAQVILITHLPQISVYGDIQFKVEKISNGRRTFTNIRKLDNNERKIETARMLSGEEITELTIKHAEEMLTKAQGIREFYDE